MHPINREGSLTKITYVSHLLAIEFLFFYCIELVDKMAQMVYIPIVCLFPAMTNREILSLECACIIF